VKNQVSERDQRQGAEAHKDGNIGIKKILTFIQPGIAPAYRLNHHHAAWPLVFGLLELQFGKTLD